MELFYIIHKIPFSQGYEFYKWKKIKKILDSNNKNLSIKNVGGLDERIIEYRWVFNELRNAKKGSKILDAGSTINFPEIISRLKDNFKITIQTLYPENYCFYDQSISYHYDDLSNKLFNKNTFDVVTCISTLEHVGFNNEIYNYKKFKLKKNKNNYLDVIKNFKHLLKPNGKLLLTIPFGKYKKFKNYQIFNQKMLSKIIKIFKPKKYKITYVKYYYGSWEECSARDIGNFFLKHKSIHSVRDNLASSRFVALIKLIK